LLDQSFASGATAAYSLRKLKSSATKAVRVREASGNTEADIGFLGGTLDTTALLNHCGSANGFVTKWYDQSGNGNDASNSTASEQPQIVDNGSVIKENGKPAIQASGSQTFKTPIKANEIITTAGENTTITVFNCDSSKRKQAILGRKSNPKFTILPNFGGSIIYDKGNTVGNRLSVSSSGTLDKQNLASFFGNGDQTIRYNGINLANSTTSGAINTTNNKIFLLSVRGDNVFKGTVQEIIFYPEAKDNQISDIETNINEDYSIF